jgi:hypothetical protein
MKSQETRNEIVIHFHLIRIFAQAELRRNLLTFLLPAPIWLGIQIYRWCTAARPLGLYGTWSILITAAFFAMTYGLQCFSNETDRKTLDFILTRPLSPYLIISVKYALSLIFLLGWIAILATSVPLSLQQLPLVEGMGPEWILLILLMVHSISFFSGLLAKGLERFFVVTVMTGLLAGISFYLWTTCLNLLKANVYWFDILPNQLNMIKTVIPTYLALLCLATPFISTVWYLRSRIPVWRFKPTKWLIGFWLGSYGAVLCCLWIFAPPLWPNNQAFYGDWHETAGILLSGPVEIGGDDATHKIKNTQVTVCQISLARFGRKSRRIYAGKNIIKPHFSPDGTQIVFTEQRRIKILNLRTHQLTVVGPGDLAAWSADNHKLICTRIIGKQDLSSIYIYNLSTKKITALPHTLQIADLVWDSPQNIVYFLGYQKEVGALNLKTRKITTYTAKTAREKPLNYYGIVSPTLIYIPELRRLVWGQVFEDELRIFELNPKSGDITLVENIVSSRIKNAAPLLINSKYQAYLWQRSDGSFVYQATKYYSNKGHHHVHEHHHEHNGEQ